MKRLFSVLLSILIAASLFPAHVCAAQRISDMVSRMTLREKLLQMLMVDFRTWDPDPSDGAPAAPLTSMNDQLRQILAEYPFGAVIYFAQNLMDTEQSRQLSAALQRAVISGGGLPMLIATDQEGGSVYRLGSGTALPGNMALGATGDPEYARLAGQIAGRELSALGINANLAPVVDVNSNANNPVIGLRSFGGDAELVSSMAAAFIAGVSESNVISCVKHFPGHGDTATDSHYGLPRVERSLEELRACELLPYQAAIAQDVDMVMTAHILYPKLEPGRALSQKTGRQEALPATMSQNILTMLLKEELGFSGIIVTDAMNMAGITQFWDSVQAAVLAIRAGADMLCMPCTISSPEDLSELDAILRGLEEAVIEGTIPLSRIDDAVTRVLTVKEKRGILSWDEADFPPERAAESVGCDEHRRLEREMAAAAVTVVQNRENTLPLTLTDKSRVLMLVPHENERAQMLMGWNRARQAGLIPDGAQVRDLRFEEHTQLSDLQSELDWADIVILVSEVSRAAHMDGGSWQSALPLEVIAYAALLGKITVVQSVDKPYDVQSYPGAHAVLAVYGHKGSSLDPTQVLTGNISSSQTACGPNLAAGVEVIFGVFGAEGTLPVDVPQFSDGAYISELAYPQGYGLHYEKRAVPSPEAEPETPTAPELPDIPQSPTVPTEPSAPLAGLSPLFVILIPLSVILMLLLLLGRKRGKRER